MDRNKKSVNHTVVNMRYKKGDILQSGRSFIRIIEAKAQFGAYLVHHIGDTGRKAYPFAAWYMPTAYLEGTYTLNVSSAHKDEPSILW